VETLEELTDAELLEQRGSLAIAARYDADAREELRDVDAELDRRASVRRERHMVATTTDINEDIDAARATLVELLQRWAARRGPMAAVNLHGAIAWQVAEALSRDQGEVMAGMVASGPSMAAPMLARRRTGEF
jgi:hypothetical protein